MEFRPLDIEAFISSLNLSDFEVFRTAQRVPCDRCGSRKMVYCDKCMRLLAPRDTVPVVTLPLEVHVLKHIAERSSKSTVIPLAFLAPDSVKITTCMPNDGAIPQYDAQDTVLVFPSEDARLIHDLTTDELMRLKRVVFVDSTWGQTISMCNSAALQSLPNIKLQNYSTIFWRLQNESREFLSTVEAIYYFFVEYIKELKARGLRERDYEGEFDNLLWHYVYTYKLIQGEYTEGRKKGKTFKKDPEYIQKLKKEE